MQTFGELPELYQKWWKKEYNNTYCDMLTEKKANELGFSKLGGVFIIVAFFLCLSFIILLIEIFWDMYKTSKNKVNYLKHIY